MRSQIITESAALSHVEVLSVILARLGTNAIDTVVDSVILIYAIHSVGHTYQGKKVMRLLVLGSGYSRSWVVAVGQAGHIGQLAGMGGGQTEGARGKVQPLASALELTCARVATGLTEALPPQELMCGLSM